MAAKYDRIASGIRHRITSETYAPGQRLPAETDLVREFGVSLNTIRRALEQLEAEGLVARRQGIGNFVREQRQRLHRSTDRYQWEKDRALLPEEQRRATGATEYDTGLVVADLDFRATYERITADLDLAQVFAVDEGTPILKRTYETRKWGESAPLGLGSSYLLISMIDSNSALLDSTNEPWPGGTQHQFRTVGIEVDHIIDRVTARAATASEADTLDIKPGSPILALRKISVDTAGRVVEVSDAIWPGDRIEMSYTTTLDRWPA